MAEFLQLFVNGLAVGCIYGLVALGFVLIYKAGEVVNFAQGELVMLGAFVAFTFVVQFGLNYWVGLALAIVAMATFGGLLDMIVVRRIIGQPQFSTVMLTIGIGVVMRAPLQWSGDRRRTPCLRHSTLRRCASEGLSCRLSTSRSWRRQFFLA
jgi:branched-chain amino acid transport system permease protein